MSCFQLLMTSFSFALFTGAGTFCIVDDFLKKDFSLPRTAFTYYKHSDIYRCASSCFMTSLCKSFHLEIDSRLCVLFHRNSSQVELTSKPGVIFSDISHWPQSLAGRCNGRGCSNIGYCVPLKGGRTPCVHTTFTDVGWAQNKSYKIFTSAFTWQNAEENCKNENGQLLLLSTLREITFFEELITDSDRMEEMFWVGANRSNSGWNWLNGDQISADQVQNGESKGDCGAYQFGVGLLGKKCTREKRSICEFN